MTASDHSYESPKDRASLAREAGLGRLSFPSILAAVLVAYGAFAVLAALVGTVAAAIGLNTDLNRNDWATLGLGSAVAVAVIVLAADLFGGYVAWRMARRAGLLNGLAPPHQLRHPGIHTRGAEGQSPSDLTIGLVECAGGTGPVRGSSVFAIVPAWR